MNGDEPMPTIAVWLMDGERVAQALQDSRERLDGADGEVVLDFGLVRRIDPAALRALEELAAGADAREIKIRLRGVSPDVYTVMKLVKLAPRFSFLT